MMWICHWFSWPHDTTLKNEGDTREMTSSLYTCTQSPGEAKWKADNKQLFTTSKVSTVHTNSAPSEGKENPKLFIYLYECFPTSFSDYSMISVMYLFASEQRKENSGLCAGSKAERFPKELWISGGTVWTEYEDWWCLITVVNDTVNKERQVKTGCAGS